MCVCWSRASVCGSREPVARDLQRHRAVGELPLLGPEDPGERPRGPAPRPGGSRRSSARPPGRRRLGPSGTWKASTRRGAEPTRPWMSSTRRSRAATSGNRSSTRPGRGVALALPRGGRTPRRPARRASRRRGRGIAAIPLDADALAGLPAQGRGRRAAGRAGRRGRRRSWAGGNRRGRGRLAGRGALARRPRTARAQAGRPPGD